MNAKNIIKIGWSCINVALIKTFHFYSFSIKGIPISVPCCFTISKGTITLGKRANILKGCHVAAVEGGSISIGDAVFINRNCEIISRESISIGNGCRFGPNVCVYDHNHCFDYYGVKDEYNTKKVSIEEKCWIGANVVILKGSTIGKCSIIAAGTIIRGNIPPHSLVFPSGNIVTKPIVEG